ncbi:MAG: hypothetical protein GY841_07490 [FCB group bacterium]|nr:hypothetical protein [FCB group bacterium]
MFDLGMRLFGMLVGAIGTVIKAAFMGITGWFKFVLSCVNIVDNIREFSGIVKEYRALTDVA